MKKISIFCLCLVFFAFNQATFGQNKVKFTHVPPSIGDTRTSTDDFSVSMNMEVKAGGEVVQNMNNKEVKSSAKKETVLAVNGKKISKVKVEYTKHEKDGNPMPTVGKSYIVTRKDGNLIVTDDKGNPTDDEGVVSEDYKDFGNEKSSLEEFLNGKEVAIGEALSVPQELVKGIFGAGGSDSDKVEKFSLTLKSVKKIGNANCGVFDMALSISANEGGMEMKMSATGETVVFVNNCAPASMTMKGTISMYGAGEGMEMNGTGDLNGAMSATYGK